MAELLSVQIHVPLVLDDSGRFLEQTIFGGPAGMASPFGGIATRLKKVDNRTMETASAFTQLPKKKAIDIEFKDLTYTVSEGRKKGRPYIRNLTKFVLSTTPRPNLGAYPGARGVYPYTLVAQMRHLRNWGGKVFWVLGGKN